jgi:hypothetical protein
MIEELQSSLPQKRGESAYMNQESGWYDNTDNLYLTYTEPGTSSYSVQLSYRDIGLVNKLAVKCWKAR